MSFLDFIKNRKRSAANSSAASAPQAPMPPVPMVESLPANVKTQAVEAARPAAEPPEKATTPNSALQCSRSPYRMRWREAAASEWSVDMGFLDWLKGGNRKPVQQDPDFDPRVHGHESWKGVYAEIREDEALAKLRDNTGRERENVATRKAEQGRAMSSGEMGFPQPG